MLYFYKSRTHRKIATDIGLPSFGLRVGEDSQLKVGLNYGFNFTFGLKKDGEGIEKFIFETPEDEDLTINLEASIPDFDVDGTLGFLKFDITDEDADDNDSVSPTKLDLGLVADLDGAEVKDFETDGSAEVNLNLKNNILDAKFLPSIDTDLNINWDFTDNNNDPTPTIAFNNIQLDLGSVFNSFAEPVLDIAQNITDTKPIKKITEILGQEVPLIDASLITVAEELGTVDKGSSEFVNAAIKITEIINSIPKDANGVKINLGSFTVNGNEPQNAELVNSNAIIPQKAGEPQPESLTKFTTILDDNPIFEFPILTKPKETVFNLLLGKEDTELFQLDLPTLGLGFEYESPPIPIFGPLTAVIIGQAGAAASISFGFDAYGLQQFRDGGFTNPELIANGFYVTSPDKPNFPAPLKPKEDQKPVLGLGAGILADVGVDLGVIRASVDAGVIGSVYLDLAEKRTRIPDFKDLSCVFELNGSLDATLGAKLRIGFGPFSFRKRIEIIRETLVDFKAGCSKSRKDNGQAVKDEQNILTLTTGEDNDFITVDYVSGIAGNETVDVSSNTIKRVDGKERAETSHKGVNSYSDIQEIKANGKGGNDRIELDDKVLTSALLTGGDGEDELQGGKGDDTLRGNEGDDYLFGGDGNDTLEGGVGNDFLEGGKGNDSIDGGDGFDSISFSTAKNGVNIDLSKNAENVSDGDGGKDTITGIEQIEGSNRNDVIIGNNNNNKASKNFLESLRNIFKDDDDTESLPPGDVIDGLEGDDILAGLGGDDLLIGGLGADTLNGGDGFDAVSYLDSNAPVYINLENQGKVFSPGGEADGDVLEEIESIQATIYDDILIGDYTSNFFDASEGDDRIYGKAGDDGINAGFGNDTVIGGAGKDILNGGGLQNDSPGEDWVSYVDSSGGVEVSLKTGEGFGGDAEGDTLVFSHRIIRNDNPKEEEEETKFEKSEYNSFENLEGSNFNDILLEGDIGNNKIEGLNGNDNLKGDQGNDTLIGGAGADNLDGGSGFDWADYSDSPEAVSVDIAVNFTANGHAQGDTFVKNKDNISTVENLLGSDYDDYLIGDKGNNQINPGLGNGTDIVDGLEGSDRLIIDYSRDDVGTGIRGGYNLGSATGGFLSRNKKDGSSLKDAVSFENIEEIQVIGTFKDDEIYGGAGNDKINSGGGNDTIYGGQGSNRIFADHGNDIVVDQNDVNRQLNGSSSNLINLDGGRGIDTLSVDLSGKVSEIVLESTNINAENFNQKLSLSDGSAISNFEIFKDIRTGSGNDKLTQLGRVNNSFHTGSGNDIVNPGLGFDDVNGGYLPQLTYTLIKIPGDDLLILDYSVEDTGTGVHFFKNIPSVKNIETLENLNIINANKNILPALAEEYDLYSGFYARATADKTDILDQVQFSDFERFNITGTSKSDSLVGRNLNDILIGKDGNDILIGNYGNDILEGGNGDDILVGTTRSFIDTSREIDTLTGGGGADKFWLGTNKLAPKDDTSSLTVYPDIDANSNYTLITDFNPNEGDTINLYSCDPSNPQEYSLGSSPQNLPLGTAIFNEDNLVAIVQGANNLSLDGDYFSFVQDNDCPPPVKPVIGDIPI